MHLKFRNVNDAFRGTVYGIHSGSIPTITMSSRVGEVLVVEEPVIVTYDQPCERVLFNKARDANPFFHLFEALWMLAGKNTVAELDYYASEYSKITSDDGTTANGAYGYRWRKALLRQDYDSHHPHMFISTYEEGVENADVWVDQLEMIIDHFKRKPESRRVVLDMWTVEDDLMKIDTSKDVCCNLNVIFSVEQGECRTCENRNKVMFFLNPGPCPDCGGPYGSVGHERPRYLNMNVINRSNDIVWGLFGANVVHFSVLQEYLAAHIGLDVGVYHQITTNFHAYTERWKPEKWLNDDEPDYYLKEAQDWAVRIPLVLNPSTFDEEVVKFVERWGRDQILGAHWKEPFLEYVAEPMMAAFMFHKQRDYVTAHGLVQKIQAKDWHIAAENWLQKREEGYAKRPQKVEGYSKLWTPGGAPPPGS